MILHPIQVRDLEKKINSEREADRDEITKITTEIEEVMKRAMKQ